MHSQNLSILWHRILLGGMIAAILFGIALPRPLMAADDDFDDEEEETGAEQTAEVVPQKTWEEEKQEIANFMQASRDAKRRELQETIKPRDAVDKITELIRKRRYVKGLGSFKILRLPDIQINWKNFSEKPTKSKEQIVAEIQEEAEVHAIEKIQPEECKRQIVEEAEEKFRMVKIGDSVSVILRGGRGTSAILDDVCFERRDNETVYLGGRRVIRDDLSEEDQAKFYKDVNERAKAEYLHNMQGAVDVKVASLTASEILERTAPAFLENNYIPDISKETASLRTSKPDFWLPKYEFVNKVRNRLIADEMQNFEKNVLPELMRKQGYILYETQDGKSEWITEAEKQRRENPQLQQGGPGGAGGPPPAP